MTQSSNFNETGLLPRRLLADFGPRPAPGIVRRLSRTLDGDQLDQMTPRDVIAVLERTQGALESAHYAFQSGSEVELFGEGFWSVEGGLSVVDCSLDDPEDPTSGRRMWIGGFELDGAPEEFNKQFERSLALSLHDREVLQLSARWSDARITDNELVKMRRTLDGGVDEEWSDGARTWERKIEVSREAPSPVAFRRDDDPCPDEMTLHLVLRDHLKIWALVEGEGETGAVLRPAQNLAPETIGVAKRVAVKVGDEPEIIEPAQRVPRLRAIATPVRKTTVHQLSLPTGRLAPPVIDLRLPRVRKELRGF